MRICVLIALAAVLAGCAKSPESISASYVSDITYRQLSCADLSVESARLQQALVRASAQQEQARGNDTVGVILLGLPVSSLSGDNVAPEIARLKGELEALHRTALQKKCSLPPIPTKQEAEAS